MNLHNFFRSSASWRVRIALNLKGLKYDYRSIHLRRNGGEQFTQEFRALNPHSLVPVLDDDGRQLTQSLAIIEYLDELHPEPPLLPKGAFERARARALALSIACDLHPLNNLRVLNYLTNTLGTSDETKMAWYRHWVELGLGALEAQLVASALTGQFCQGNTPGMADCCLIPQLFQARRFECDLSAYPTLLSIEQNCNQMPAFQAAAPGRQPDANG
jgi:maleylacetoacetate isomerase